jgi:hypothetical protein
MKNVKAPNIVLVGVITVITIVLWIIYGVYKLVTTPQDINVPNEVLSPVSPNLDTEALNTLQQRIFFSENQLTDINLIKTPEPEASPTASPTATPQQQEATSSAQQETATTSGETSQ